jgi:isoquinoline 1-oxidoreductase beta subunit
MASIGKIARRTFLFGAVAVAGGAVFGWWRYTTPYGNPLETDLAEGSATLNPYVMIDAKGVTIIAPRAEMGQGIHTTLAALVAEEMDLDLSAVTVIHGPASAAYFNAGVLEEGAPFLPTDDSWLAETVRGAMHVPGKFLGFQITGGSSSVVDAFDKMRLAGAAARAALVQVAAARLGVAAETLKTEGGAVLAPDGSRLSYVDLAAEAATVSLARAPEPKPRAEWRLLGKSQPRVDMLAKVTGTAAFTGDLRLPGMKFATARTNPHLGSGMRSYDASAAEAMPGVERIVEIPGGVAVVASSTWAALMAAEAITFDWEPASYPADSAGVFQVLADSFIPDRQDSRIRDDGDVEAALTGDILTAEYTAPYLAHATMEPMTAAALLTDGKLTVWAGNQLPTQILTVGEEVTGLPATAISVETTFMGGGFGRRAEMDVIRQVVTLAKAMEGTPVLLTWSREEDMSHDFYRPAAIGRVRAKLEGGVVTAFDLSSCSSSVMESQVGRLGYSIPGPDNTIVQGAADQPYAFANYRVTGYRAPAMLPVGSWRSVGNSQNVFFSESAVDELAHLAGADPVAFRLAHLTHEPSRKVIEAVAKMSDWGNVPAGRARGIAFCIAFGVPSAQVIEVEDTGNGLRMTGAWAAVDVGIALDPSILEAQVSGAMAYGLSAAIRGEITLAEGQVEQKTFWDFEPLRMPQMPKVAVQVLENLPRIRGIGEPGTPPAAPALANAIFALTGQRLRDMPFNRTISFA